jgi:hypothetical protein
MKNQNLVRWHLMMGILVLVGMAHPVSAQQIIIDQSIKAGDLTLFPEMGNENVYYYLPDQLQLAKDANGKPQFSFLKYVENVRSAPGDEDIREGEGGGIVHAVVSLEVTPEQLSEAKNALRRIDAQGTIKGPVIYTGGTMAIVSSFTNTNGELAKQVVGIGNAPLIDGHKAAVSIELTKKGAKILWESFKTPTPDMSFSFEMELSGFRAPKKAIIEADFDKIYSHQAFQAGAMGNYGSVVFGGEIELAFDELRNSGAINITNMGTDAEMDKLIESAYNKLTTMMFNPVGTGNPAVEAMMKSISGKKSALDRATDLYKIGSKSGITAPPKKKKTAYFFQNHYDDEWLLASTGRNFYSPGHRLSTFQLAPPEEWTPKHIKEHYKDFIQLLSISAQQKKEAAQMIDDGIYVNPGIISKTTPNIPYLRTYMMTDADQEKFDNLLSGAADVSPEFITLIRERVSSIVYKQDFLNEKQKSYILNVSVPDTSRAWDLNLALTYIAWVNRNEVIHMPEVEKYAVMVRTIEDLKTQDNQISTENPDSTKKEQPSKPDSLNTDPFKLPELDQSPVVGDKVKSGTGEAVGATTKKPDRVPVKSGEKSTGSVQKANSKDFRMAVMASYQLKKIRQKGRFKINLNKYTADKVVLRFDENIGSINCDECFYEVNLDDPMFKQREIVAVLDGFNFDDFGKYINYVNLKLKKTHQNGEITMDELRIDRDHFMKASNNFKVMYGWKGDANRQKWFDYEVQTQWSFFGGIEMKGEWQKANANIVNLAAPYRRETIELEADPELLKDNKVRSVTVKIYYKVGEKEQVETVSMLPSRGQYSKAIDVMMPDGNLQYEYEIAWRLFGNQSKSSGRLSSGESILFVDEM